MIPFDDNFYNFSQTDALYAKAKETLGEKALNDLIQKERKHILYQPEHHLDFAFFSIVSSILAGLIVFGFAQAKPHDFGIFSLFGWVVVFMGAMARMFFKALTRNKKEILVAFYLQQQTQGWSAQQIRDLQRTKEFHACKASQGLLQKMADAVEKQRLPSAQDLVCAQKDPEMVSLNIEISTFGQPHALKQTD